MSIIISSASSPAPSAPATMVSSVTEMATAAADLATVGMVMAAEKGGDNRIQGCYIYNKV